MVSSGSSGTAALMGKIKCEIVQIRLMNMAGWQILGEIFWLVGSSIALSCLYRAERKYEHSKLSTDKRALGGKGRAHLG